MSLTETRPDLDHQFGYLDWHQSMWSSNPMKSSDPKTIKLKPDLSISSHSTISYVLLNDIECLSMFYESIELENVNVIYVIFTWRQLYRDSTKYQRTSTSACSVWPISLHHHLGGCNWSRQRSKSTKVAVSYCKPVSCKCY